MYELDNAPVIYDFDLLVDHTDLVRPELYDDGRVLERSRVRPLATRVCEAS
ncbi:hypothetical protein [Halomicrobium katesii]|uniref:hypothetical protein n=1 Tax=Halomicrobium katesii TaxID=437163 RepID=UPI00035DF532|nr:hypothetical protein [Halomicrobium katesii]